MCIEKFKAMRTNIDIDDKLMKEAMMLSTEKNKKGMVNLALTEFIKLQKRQKFKELFGKVKWEGDLKEMRSS